MTQKTVGQRVDLLRDAYTAVRRHSQEREAAESAMIYAEMEMSIRHEQLADALGMAGNGRDLPDFEEMLARIREIRLTFKRRA